MPLLYTLVLGLLISIPKFKILTIEQMEKSADYIGIAVMILMVKVGLGIGPNLGILTSAGWALFITRTWSLLRYYHLRFTSSFISRHAP